RALDEQITPGTGDDGTAGERLASLEADQLRKGDVDAVLPGDVLRDPGPTTQTDGPTGGVVGGTHSSGRARAGNDDDLSAVQRREHGRERMPGVFADQDGGPTPARVEGLHRAARLDKPLLVEDTVGGEKYLAVDVADAGFGPSQGGVEPGVEEPILMHLVETECHIDRCALGILVLTGQIVEQPVGRDRQVAYAAFEEI